MFMEWWMIGILIAASVGWGEYRYRNGYNDTVSIMSGDIVMAHMQGSMGMLDFLSSKKLIHVDENNSIVGYEGNKVTFEDADLQLAKRQVTEILNKRAS